MQTLTELVKMAGDCTHNPQHYGSGGAAETFRPPSSATGAPPAVVVVGGRRGPPPPSSPNFEVIDGLLYRRKLERGFINYREVLPEERRHEAVSAFHRRRRAAAAAAAGLRQHLSFEETYKSVAENYWWDGKLQYLELQ